MVKLYMQEKHIQLPMVKLQNKVGLGALDIQSTVTGIQIMKGVILWDL